MITIASSSKEVIIQSTEDHMLIVAEETISGPEVGSGSLSPFGQAGHKWQTKHFPPTQNHIVVGGV